MAGTILSFRDKVLNEIFNGLALNAAYILVGEHRWLSNYIR